jgi:ferrous iron transport protein A
MVPLSSLAPGTQATVLRIDIPVAQRVRLMEMGMIPGTVVDVVRFAPLGDPLEIRLRGYHLSLRKRDAEQIWVQP